MRSGALRLGICETTIFAPRSFKAAMIQLASNALSAIRPPNSMASISGATPTVSWRFCRQQMNLDLGPCRTLLVPPINYLRRIKVQPTSRFFLEARYAMIRIQQRTT
jgi:hypothetical protein